MITLLKTSAFESNDFCFYLNQFQPYLCNIFITFQAKMKLDEIKVATRKSRKNPTSPRIPVTPRSQPETEPAK